MTSCLTARMSLYLLVSEVLTHAFSSHRWTREFHLHLSNRSSRDRGGSAGQPHGQLPGGRPVRVLLVPYVRVTHRCTAHQAAQTDRRRTGPHPAVDGQRSPRQPLAGRSRPCAAHQQTLSGKWKLTHLSVRLLFGHLPAARCSLHCWNQKEGHQQVTVCSF